jgi:hypothetical protein
MFAHRAAQGTRSNSVNDSDLVAPLGGCEIEGRVESVECLIDAKAA